MAALTRPALRIVRPERELHGHGTPLGRRIRRALVCLDGTPASEVGLPYAQIVAETFSAELTLTHVIPSVAAGSRTNLLEWEIARRESDRYLETAREVLQQHLPSSVASLVTQGSPGDQLALTAREIDADLVIVGGACSLDRRGAPLGGVVQRLLGFTSASLLVAQGSATVPPRRITVLLDGSSRTESVLPSVVSLAQRYGSEVTLVHVVVERPSSAVAASPSDVMLSQQLSTRFRQNAEEYLERIRTRELRDVPKVRRVARVRADERRALLEIATQVESDLVVLSAHGATCDPNDACGGVASYVLSHANVPLLVLQDVASVADHGDTAGMRRPSGIRLREEA
jgi:nucleotide-binding universal stress UspA family protein